MIALVIGGTGTLGKVLVPKLIADPAITRIRILSRHEHDQMWLARKWASDKVDFFLGDVRDKERVWLASRKADVVYHLAALKSVDKAEYNPNEAIQTNIEGTRNVIDACIKNNVPKAVFTSTDKAADPYNIYGASKLVAEKLWIQSNNYSTQDGTNFIAVRYGNVLGSNGSVIQKWAESAPTGEIHLINGDMTRFWMTQEQAANLVLRASRIMLRKVTVIPVLKSCNMSLLARVFKNICTQHGHNIAVRNMAPRGAEKLHETLISRHEASQCLNLQRDEEGNRAYLRFGDDVEIPANQRLKDFKGLSSDQAESWDVMDLTNAVKGVFDVVDACR